MQSLMVVVTAAFMEEKPAFASVYNAYYNACMDRQGSVVIANVVKAGLLQGGKLRGMNEARFKARAARIGTAMVCTSAFIGGYQEMVTEVWNTVRKQAAVKIQQEWRNSWSCPERLLCCRRLMEEWEWLESGQDMG